MTAALSLWMALFSVLVPQKMWFAPNQAITIKSDKEVTLQLEGYFGQPIAPTGSSDIAANQTADLRSIYPQLTAPGLYVLYALPKGAQPSQNGPPKDFLGTPIVVECMPNRNGGNIHQLDVVRMVPLQYAVINTDAGEIKCIFYYDAAPHTVDEILRLASEGYYDGLLFHRVVPGFVIQGGDPMATGEGGPGYHLDAEFSPRPHNPGVLSMARLGDSAENPQDGTMPRPQYANSAGSQFFICLDAEHCQTLNGRYTAFGEVVAPGMDVVNKIATAKLADPQTGKPETPVKMQTVQVRPVTAADNPYIAQMTPPVAPGAPAAPPAPPATPPAK